MPSMGIEPIVSIFGNSVFIYNAHAIYFVSNNFDILK